MDKELIFLGILLFSIYCHYKWNIKVEPLIENPDELEYNSSTDVPILKAKSI